MKKEIEFTEEQVDQIMSCRLISLAFVLLGSVFYLVALMLFLLGFDLSVKLSVFIGAIFFIFEILTSLHYYELNGNNFDFEEWESLNKQS